MATYAYDDFRIEFDPERDGRYPVRASTPRGTRAVGDFVVPVGQEDLERAVLGIIRSLGSTRRATWGPADTPAELATIEPGEPEQAAEPAQPGEPSDDEDRGAVDGTEVVTGIGKDVERFGARLAEALFAGPIGTAYEAASASAPPERGLRLTLALGRTPELLGLPWELLYRRPVFLASQRRTPLVRELIAGRRVAPPTIDDVVRILGVVASPSDLDPLRVDVERDRIAEAVAPMVALGRVQLDWLDPATPRGLQQALRDGSYHIVHFVGHSDVTDDGEGVLFLEDPDTGSSVAIDGTVLANLLADQSCLRLVVLNSCKAARTSLQDAYAGVATTLVGLGVPAVVAMQFEISDEAAVVFAEELYTNLIGRQAAIDAAVAEARKAVLVGIGNGEWATPVLFVQDPDTALFDFRHAGEPGTAVADGPATTPAADANRRPAAAWRHRIGGRTTAVAIAVAVLAGLVAGALRWWPDGDRSLVLTTTTVSTTTVTAAPRPAVRFPSLIIGDEGLVVQTAQLLLRADGAAIAASGEVDDPTANAIRAFDASRGLPRDAIVGELTWSELVPPLRRGAAGEAVLAAQLLLNANGAGVAIDGEFGAPTEGATKAFERSVGLRQDGIIDIEVWKHLIAAIPPDTPAKATVAARPVPTTSTTAPTTTVSAAGNTVSADRPRSRTPAVAAVVAEDGSVRIRTLELDGPRVPPGEASNLPGAIDGHPSWSPPSNRLAFDRRFPGSDEIGVLYVVPGVTPDDGGKAPAPLITGRNGTERLPTWSTDGGLLYVATSACSPGPGCPDNIRRATFTVSSDQPLEGPYLGAPSQDTLTIRSDLLVAGPFSGVRSLAADPARVDSFAVVDDAGLWLVSAGGTVLIVPDEIGSVAFTGDGQRLVVGDPAAPGGTLRVYDRDGALVAGSVLSDLEPVAGAEIDAAIPATGRLLSVSTRPGAATVAVLVDDADDALPGVVADVDVSDDRVTIARTWALPAALGNEPATAVAV